MKRPGVFSLILVFIVISPKFAAAVAPTADELAQSRDWAAGRFDAAKTAADFAPFFSFTYDGTPSAEILKTWEFKKSSRQLDDQRKENTLTFTDPKSGLELRCVGVQYPDFPTVEWTLYFKNTSDKDTPILSDIQALDAVFPANKSETPLLHHFKGDRCTKDSFEPLRTPLTPGIELRFVPAGGRPSNGEWPYYNLEGSSSVILAIGWPGQWACRFTRGDDNDIHICAGQELTRFKLHPGEEVRTPLVALLFYHRDWVAGQNLWRRWMFARNFPKDHGKPLAPKFAAFCGNYFPGYRTNQQSEIDFIGRFVAEGFHPDYWWIDAGWYPCPDDWGPVGTWKVDRTRFPDGLHAVSDRAHANGMDFILWFEPERVAPNTDLADNHPEWILGGKNGGLLDFGNPDAWKWITDRIDKIIVDEGVDIYRQDFNMDPLPYWRANDAADRQGITEIKHIQGYLAFWDELQRRHPGMLIDSCASGGRRNDLETMRRAVPFLRSDYCTDPEGMQCHTYGFNMWLPYYRGATDKIDLYDFRSNISPLMMMAWDMRDRKLDYALARKLIEQWRQVACCLFGDFYPLTDYNVAGDTWMAWQFDRPEQSDGFVQAFRRAANAQSSKTLKLQGLDAAATYILTDFDTKEETEMTARRLMEDGLAVSINNQPGAVLIAYRKKP
jgi:alpha-galactosidase